MPTNHEVARKWLSGKEAKSSNGNLSCVSHTLYSYNTPIAHVRDGAVLLTCESFSVTTEGKHKNAAKKAACYSYFEVPYLLLDPGSYGGRGRSYANASLYDQHAANVQYLYSKVVEEEARLKRARKYTDTRHLERLKVQLSNYKQHFRIA